jgi:uncharacterized protein YbaP (TraB family)
MKMLRPILIFLVVLACSFAVQAQDVISRVMPQKYLSGVFWKIEKEGVQPSYLLGTVHLDHPRVIALLTRFDDEFKSARIVCTEVKMDFQAAAAEMKAMFYRDGRTLKTVINDDALYSKVIHIAAERGMPEGMLVMMKPWAVMYMLSVPDQKGMVLDQKVFTEAQRAGKNVCGLEDVNKHVNAFEVFTLKEQITMLRLTLDHIDEISKMNGMLMKAYLAADLKQMASSVAEAPGMKQNAALMEKFLQKLVIDRNREMLKNMKIHLPQGGGFFAVGAMHLTGEAGLLRLLEGLGYKLTRVY